MGGFECASHLRRDRKRIDVIGTSRHDLRCGEDYRLLAEAGLRTVRDGLRWHLIERVPGRYDWASFLPMLRAAESTGTEVIWDLCHWGVPDFLDIFGAEFPGRFAAFARAAARLVVEEGARWRPAASGWGARGEARPNFYTPMNEISFWSWVGGDLEHFAPYGKDRGGELKRQLVRASIAAMRAIREVDPGARFVQPEPIIHVSAGDSDRGTVDRAARQTESQFEVWDMLTGRRDPELGGDGCLLDIVGTNFYWNNQWVDRGERTPPGHAQHRPLHDMLRSISDRYGRPIVMTETGAEAGTQAGWLGYVMAEVRQAQAAGVRMEGVCLYPVMDYPGWDDDRHCPCGLIKVGPRWGDRSLRQDALAEVEVQRRLVQDKIETPIESAQSAD